MRVHLRRRIRAAAAIAAVLGASMAAGWAFITLISIVLALEPVR